jgi:serine O-acetyltransferase
LICKKIRECFCVDTQFKNNEITSWGSFRLSLTEGRILAVILFRVAQLFWSRRLIWRLSPYIKRMNEILTGFECHLLATIDEGLFIAHSQNIVIGEGVRIGKNVTLYNGVTLGSAFRGGSTQGARYPIIGDNVIIYSGAKVLGPIIVGDGAIVGANAVVLKDVPAGCTAVGVPAKIIDAKATRNTAA